MGKEQGQLEQGPPALALPLGPGVGEASWRSEGWDPWLGPSWGEASWRSEQGPRGWRGKLEANGRTRLIRRKGCNEAAGNGG